MGEHYLKTFLVTKFKDPFLFLAGMEYPARLTKMGLCFLSFPEMHGSARLKKIRFSRLRKSTGQHD